MSDTEMRERLGRQLVAEAERKRRTALAAYRKVLVARAAMSDLQRIAFDAVVVDDQPMIEFSREHSIHGDKVRCLVAAGLAMLHGELGIAP